MKLTAARIALILSGLLAISACRKSDSDAAPGPDTGSPDGFKLAVYAGDVPGARSLSLGAQGTVFVSTRDEGFVYALQDTNSDGVSDQRWTIASGLNMPNGVAYHDGALFVAEVSRILRYDAVESRLDNPPEPIVVSEAFPEDRSHGWKFIAFGPDGKLYVPVGAPCNICIPPDTLYAAILRMNPDGSGLEVFASGVRNTVGFDWDPPTGRLWFTDNGRDMLGDDLPPDELNHAPRSRMFFGYPYRHGKDIVDPDLGDRMPASLTHTPPVLGLGAHVAALGMRFYTGAMFPERYRGGIFIAEHGSWNRSTKVGYRVVFVPFENGYPRLVDGSPAPAEVFLDEWLKDGRVSGRPVDVLVLPDGSLLISDDYAGKVYRVAYK